MGDVDFLRKDVAEAQAVVWWVHVLSCRGHLILSQLFVPCQETLPRTNERVTERGAERLNVIEILVLFIRDTDHG